MNARLTSPPCCWSAAASAASPRRWRWRGAASRSSCWSRRRHRRDRRRPAARPQRLRRPRRARRRRAGARPRRLHRPPGDDGRGRRSEVASVPVGEAFRQRFGNPYAVIHRADVHGALLEAVQQHPLIRFHTSAAGRARSSIGERRRAGRRRATAGASRPMPSSAATASSRWCARSCVGDAPRVSGHVVYRAVVDGGRLARGPALERAGGLGRARLPPRALPAARRRAVQRRRHLPQPRQGGVGRQRGQPGRGAVVLRRHPRAPAPAAGPARRPGTAGAPPTASRSSAGATAAPRCSATPRIRCCSTWRRAPAWRSRTR